MDSVVVSRLLLSKKEVEANAAQRLLSESAARSRDERAAAVAILITALQRDEQRLKTRATVLRSAAFLVSVGFYFSWFDWITESNNPGPLLLVFWAFFNQEKCARHLLRRNMARLRCLALRARIALALAEHGDLRALGPLVEAFAANRSEAPRPVVARALDALLPRFQPGDAAFLNPRQRDTLSTFLTNWMPERKGIASLDNARSLPALLRAAALVGDKNTVPALTALIAKEGKYDHLGPVIAAARESLSTLNARYDAWTAPAGTANAPRFRTRP